MKRLFLLFVLLWLDLVDVVKRDLRAWLTLIGLLLMPASIILSVITRNQYFFILISGSVVSLILLASIFTPCKKIVLKISRYIKSRWDCIG